MENHIHQKLFIWQLFIFYFLDFNSALLVRSTQSLEKQIDELQGNVNGLEIKYQNKESQLL